RGRRYEKLGGDRAGDLGLSRQRRREKRDALAEPVVGDAAPPAHRGAGQGLVGRAQVEPGPTRPRERPFLLVPLDEPLARMTHLQEDLRLLPPPRVLVLQEVTKELLL